MDGNEYFFEVKVAGEKIKFSDHKKAIIDTGNGTVSVPSEWLKKSEENTFQLHLPYTDEEGEEYRLPLRTGLNSYMQDTYVTSQKLSKMLESNLMPGLSEGKTTPEMVEFNLPEANLWKEKWQTDTMSEPAQSIMVSDYWRFNRPFSQLTIKDGRVAFQMAAFKANGEENTVTLRRGFKNPDGSYGEERKTVTVRQLKEMYDVQQRKEIQNKEDKDKFFVMDVRKEQVSDLMTGKNGEAYHFIHLAENCSFIRSASHLHEVKGDEEHYRLYFPLTKKDGTATEISVSRSVYADGKWNKEYKSMTLEKLEEMNRAYVPLQKRRNAERQKVSPEREKESVSIFNIRMNDEERCFRNTSGLNAEDLCKAYAKCSKPFIEMGKYGKMIDAVEYASLEQGNRLDFSVEFNEEKEQITIFDGNNFEYKGLRETLFSEQSAVQEASSEQESPSKKPFSSRTKKGR